MVMIITNAFCAAVGDTGDSEREKDSRQTGKSV